MEEHIKNKLTNILSGFGKNGNTAAVSELLKSEEGKKLISSLSENDKKAILSKFMSMDANEIKEKLKNANPTALNKLTAEDIRKKLR